MKSETLPEEPKKKSHFILWFLTTIAILALVVSVGFQLYSLLKTKEANTEEVVPSKPSTPSPSLVTPQPTDVPDANVDVVPVAPPTTQQQQAATATVTSSPSPTGLKIQVPPGAHYLSVVSSDPRWVERMLGDRTTQHTKTTLTTTSTAPTATLAASRPDVEVIQEIPFFWLGPGQTAMVVQKPGRVVNWTVPSAPTDSFRWYDKDWKEISIHQVVNMPSVTAEKKVFYVRNVSTGAYEVRLSWADKN